MKKRFDSKEFRRHPDAGTRSSRKAVRPAAPRQLMIALGWLQLFRAIIAPNAARRG